ncbi:hypothetical protein [Phaeobacter sp. HF9A]|uniref:hypothetical protein n=1 Tax=Phaeobacter sp. HF9A TaxID=2721561 RepID=UPI0014320DFB|nr:hypothetical protein [Phaeobacter sp. HF9A]NIZ12063.1 hypothetical protein [Phaeobacter sp. HF9A]
MAHGERLTAHGVAQKVAEWSSIFISKRTLVCCWNQSLPPYQARFFRPWQAQDRQYDQKAGNGARMSQIATILPVICATRAWTAASGPIAAKGLKISKDPPPGTGNLCLTEFYFIHKTMYKHRVRSARKSAIRIGRIAQIPSDTTIIRAQERAGPDPLCDSQRRRREIGQNDIIKEIPEHRTVIPTKTEKAAHTAINNGERNENLVPELR